MKFPNLGFLLLFFALISAKPFLEEIEPECPGGFFSPQLQRKPEIDKNIPERVIGGQVTVKFIFQFCRTTLSGFSEDKKCPLNGFCAT